MLSLPLNKTFIFSRGFFMFTAWIKNRFQIFCFFICLHVWTWRLIFYLILHFWGDRTVCMQNIQVSIIKATANWPGRLAHLLFTRRLQAPLRSTSLLLLGWLKLGWVSFSNLVTTIVILHLIVSYNISSESNGCSLINCTHCFMQPIVCLTKGKPQGGVLGPSLFSLLT